jgi:hypothetical protein
MKTAALVEPGSVEVQLTKIIPTPDLELNLHAAHNYLLEKVS